MQSSDILLEAKNISKEYTLNDQNFKALDSISFKLKKNEGIGLIGKNGSGKSTLLKILAGLIKPSEGEVFIYGKVNSLIELGSNFIPDLTGRENVKQFLKLNSIPNKEIDSLTKRIYSYSELGDFFDQPVKFYSSGMFVRLAISAGFEINADIFLMDEILMAGDASFKDKIAKRFKKLIDQGKSVIIASHNTEEILKYTSQCFWLEKGLLVEKKSSAEALKDYYFEYAKELSLKKNKANNIFIEHNKNDDKNEKFAHFEILNAKEIDYHSGVSFEIAYSNVPEIAKAFPVVKVYTPLLKPLFALIPTIKIRENLKSRSTKSKIILKCQCPANLLKNGDYFAEISFVTQPVSGQDLIKEVYVQEEKLIFNVKRTNEAKVLNDSFEIHVLPEGNWKVQV
tara:strand:+ start:3019 stop:4209 length:1191 start_codon:yes stop_codon:yes gene_type:complete